MPDRTTKDMTSDLSKLVGELRGLRAAATLDYGERSGRVCYVLPTEDYALDDAIHRALPALLDAVEKASKALDWMREHGRHLAGCRMNRRNIPNWETRNCTCGMDEILSALRAETGGET